jgi:hypothetical protein
MLLGSINYTKLSNFRELFVTQLNWGNDWLCETLNYVLKCYCLRISNVRTKLSRKWLPSTFGLFCIGHLKVKGTCIVLAIGKTDRKKQTKSLGKSYK